MKEFVAFVIAMCLAGWALSAVVEPWFHVEWWRCALGIWVVRMAHRPMGTEVKP